MPAFPRKLLGALRESKQNSPTPAVLTIGTMLVQLYGASVSVVARKLPHCKLATDTTLVRGQRNVQPFARRMPILDLYCEAIHLDFGGSFVNGDIDAATRTGGFAIVIESCRRRPLEYEMGG